MDETSGQISPRIARRRELLHEHVMNDFAIAVREIRPRRILDVGTGYGVNLTFLARRFGRRSRIWSVDASPKVVRDMRKIMKEHQYSRHIIVKQANAEHLPFKSGQFELVASLFSLHHFLNPKRGLFEMGRVVSHDGKLVIADWRSAARKSLALRAHGKIPTPEFVTKQLKRSRYRISLHTHRYWYLIEASKLS